MKPTTKLSCALLVTAALVGTQAIPALADDAPTAPSLQLSSSNPVAYPYKDGYKDTVALNLNTANLDTTAPLSGQVTLVDGAKTTTTAFTLNSATSSVAVNVASLPAGTATATATLTAPDGTVVSSTPLKLSLKETAVTKVSVSKSNSTLYPVKDGYRDTEVYTVKAATTTGTTLKVSGKAVLKLGKHVVKTWKLATSGTHKLVWNGKYKSKVKAGKYTLSVSEKAAQGSTHKATAKVNVSTKHLVSRTLTKNYSAASVMGKTYYDFSQDKTGACYTNAFTYNDILTQTGTANAIFCEGTDVLAQGYTWPYSISVDGHVAVPAAVRNSTKYSTPTVSVRQHTSVYTGKAYLTVAAGGDNKNVMAGNGYTTKSVKFTGNPSQVKIWFQLDAYSWGGIKDYRVTYHYKTLV